MVVDDDPIVRAALGDELEEQGFRVLLMEDATECLAVLSEQHVDVFVLDVLMPGMDGLDLMDAIRKRPQHRSTPVIFCSATADRPDSAAAYRALGAADVVGKSDVSRVARRVRRVVDIAAVSATRRAI